MRLAARAAATLVAALTTAAGFAASPSAVAQDAPTGLSVEITSPVPTGSYLSGQQPVTVHVVVEPGVTPATATVTITSEYDQTRKRSATTTIPETCAPECDVTVTVDTVSWIDPGDTADATQTSLLDGLALVEAKVDGAGTAGEAVTGAASLYLEVRNNRPKVWPGMESSYTSYPVVGDGAIPIDAWVNAYSDGVDRLEVTLFGPGVRWRGSFPGTALDGNAQSHITGSIPTAGLATGNYVLRFVAFDSAGAPSDVVTRDVLYYSGPKVTLNRLVPTTAGALVEATMTVGPDWSLFQPRRLEVVVDGQPAATGTMTDFPRDRYCTLTAESYVCPDRITVGVPVAMQLAPGPHSVRATYTEQTAYGQGPTVRTATAGTTAQLTAAGVTAAVTVRGPVVQNASGTLAFTLTSLAGTATPASQIRSWRVDRPYATGTLASGSCTSSCLTVNGSVALKSLEGWYPTLEPRARRIVPLTLFYTDSAGITRTTTTKVAVDPAVKANLSVPATGGAGSTATATISVQQLAGQLLPGVPVTLQARTAGSTTWRTVVSTRTTSTGSVRVPVSLKYNTYWRAVIPARPGWNGGATSPQRYTKVAAKVSASGLPTTGVRGRYYPVNAALSPVSTGRRVSVQVRAYGASTWRTVLRPATNKYGQTASRVRFGRGTWQVRVVADATTASASGISRTLTIKVR